MRSSASSPCAAGCAAGLLLAGLVLAGCAASGNSSSSPSLLDKLLPKASETNVTPPPEHEGCGTPAQCKSALKHMVDNPKRGWVGHQQPAVAYTDGTRLFAYRALRTKLTCRE